MNSAMFHLSRKAEELKDMYIRDVIQHWWNYRTKRFPDDWSALKFIAMEDTVHIYKDSIALPIVGGGYAYITHFDVPAHIEHDFVLGPRELIKEIECLLNRDIEDSCYWDLLNQPLQSDTSLKSMDLLEKASNIDKLIIVAKHQLRETTEKNLQVWRDQTGGYFEATVGYLDYHGKLEYFKCELSFLASYHEFLRVLEIHRKPPFEPDDKSVMDSWDLSIQILETASTKITKDFKDKVTVLKYNIAAFRETDWKSTGIWMYSLREMNGPERDPLWVAMDTKGNYVEAMREVAKRKKSIVLLRCWQTRMSNIWTELKALEEEHRILVGPGTQMAIQGVNKPQDLKPWHSSHENIYEDICTAFIDKAFEDEPFSQPPRKLTTIQHRTIETTAHPRFPHLPRPLERNNLVSLRQAGFVAIDPKANRVKPVHKKEQGSTIEGFSELGTEPNVTGFPPDWSESDQEVAPAGWLLAAMTNAGEHGEVEAGNDS